MERIAKDSNSILPLSLSHLMNNPLHIVSFDIPYPANYGGAIDVFYKLKALSELGFEIVLHCFEYGERSPHKDLESLCKEVHYYPRQKSWNLISSLSYIVSSRMPEELLKNLIKVDAPILFEGLHCCGFLSRPELKGRKKLVRMHNIEHDYYQNLFSSERNWLKKFYYGIESIRLKSFEKNLAFADSILAISPKDFDELVQKFPQTVYLPVFHANTKITSLLSKGNFCLYHGNLRISENEEAALFLIKYVFSQIKTKLIIAGNGPSERLLKAINTQSNIQIVTNPSNKELSQLMHEAHIHVLPTFQDTGIKLKLVNVLFSGRFVLTNPSMVYKTGLESACVVNNSILEWKENINSTMANEFKISDIEKRKVVLETFDIKDNALKLKVWILENKPEPM